jgi:signal transduction histidine kinase
MAQCPAYSGPICSLCCSLETRCHDCCKPEARLANQIGGWTGRTLPRRIVEAMNTDISQYVGVLLLFAAIIGAVLSFVYFQVSFESNVQKDILKSTLWTVFFILSIIAAIAAWVFVLVHESRRVAEEETQRQTELLMQEIEAHKRTDAKLQQAKESAEAASKAKSRYVVGLSHELRMPLNAVVGYAQILERDPAIPLRRLDAIRVVRRNAEYLSGLIDGLLDISKIEAGRFHLNRNEVRLREFLDQLVDMFRLQAGAKGIEFIFQASDRLPVAVYTDENRLRQILINLLSNAIKFTDAASSCAYSTATRSRAPRSRTPGSASMPGISTASSSRSNAEAEPGTTDKRARFCHLANLDRAPDINRVLLDRNRIGAPAPASAPKPGTMFRTPGGRPASSAARPSHNAVSGVSSAGLSTMVQPHARAGAIFHTAFMRGKFHGTTTATTPTGTRWM